MIRRKDEHYCRDVVQLCIIHIAWSPLRQGGRIAVNLVNRILQSAFQNGKKWRRENQAVPRLAIKWNSLHGDFCILYRARIALRSLPPFDEWVWTLIYLTRNLTKVWTEVVPKKLRERKRNTTSCWV